MSAANTDPAAEMHNKWRGTKRARIVDISAIADAKPVIEPCRVAVRDDFAAPRCGGASGIGDKIAPARRWVRKGIGTIAESRGLRLLGITIIRRL